MKKIILASSLLLLLSGISFSQYVQSWSQLIPPVSHMNTNNSIAVDGSGSIYVLGTDHFNPNYGETTRLFLRKFDAAGNLSWTYSYGGIAPDTFAVPIDVFVDNSGNIVIDGTFDDRSSIYYWYSTVFLFKFNPQGTELFHTLYKKPGVYDLVKKTVNDNNGNFYVLGHALEVRDTVLTDSTFVCKFISNGALQWERTVNSTFVYPTRETRDIAFDNSGNILLAAQSMNQNYGIDLVTRKYNSAGTLLWSQLYPGTLSVSYNMGNGITSDASSNVYVSCGIGNANNPDSMDPAIIKYTSGGAFSWLRVFSTNHFGTENAKSIYAASDGIYFNAITDSEYVIKYDFLGNKLWQRGFRGFDYKMTPNPSGGVYFGGFETKLYRNDEIVRSLSPSGIPQTLVSYNRTGSNKNSLLAYVFPSSGGLYSASNSDSSVEVVKFIPALSHTISQSRHGLSKSINDIQLTFDTMNINPTELPAGAYVTNVTMSVDSVIHPTDFQLEFSLIHEIVTDTIIYRRGGGANFISTNLNDTASLNPICNSNLSPFTGVFQPCKPLSQFSSRPVEGPWILRIYDRFAGGTGTLKAWSLNVTYSIPIGVQQISTGIPKSFSLQQNYPNPFNPETKIVFNIPAASDLRSDNVTLRIYDAIGREVETLVNENLKPGSYEVSWNASACPSGVYFYKLTSGDYSEAKKMVLVK